MSKILLVDDDRDLAQMIKSWLESQGFILELAGDGLKGDMYVKQGSYDVIILDWDLPGMSGVDICKRYRATGGTTPVLLLTGKGEISDKEFGFAVGADDYLTKPFNMRELAARVKALSHRVSKVEATTITIGRLELNTKTRRVFKNGSEIQVLPKDFAMLQFLMQHPDEVFSTDVLLNRVWSIDSDATSDAVRTSIKRLRQSLDEDEQSSVIENIRGIGYRLSAPR